MTVNFSQIEISARTATQAADQELVRRIEIFLATHGNVAPGEIVIEARGGNLLLRGEVASEERRRLIALFSQRVRGVRSIENRIRVAGGSLEVDRPWSRYVADLPYLINHAAPSALSIS